MSYNFTQFKNDLKKVDERLSKEYSQIHTGRASPAILDGVIVESHGTHMPLKNVSSISIEGPKTLRVVPWDKSEIKGIEKAIGAANIGLSVATDDAGLRVIFPQLTTETRTGLVKILKDRLEECRITVRMERDKVWTDIQNKEKEGVMSEDDKYRSKDELQKVIDEANRNLESLFEKKEKEVMN